MSETLFFRLLAEDDKETALASAVDAVRDTERLPATAHVADPQSFRQVPGSPFAYWVSEAVRRKFVSLTSLEGSGRSVRGGPDTGQDFRCIRAFWEVGPKEIGQLRRWAPHAKGGEFSPYYSDVHLVILWGASGSLLRSITSANIRNPKYFFRPGLTWSLRTQRGFCTRALPAGCVFGHKGPAVFAPSSEIAHLLGMTNSSCFRHLVALQMTFGSYEVGTIQRTPVPENLKAVAGRLGGLATDCVDRKRTLNKANETSHVFHLPAVIQVRGDQLLDRCVAWNTHLRQSLSTLACNQIEVDELAYEAYGISDEDRRSLEASLEYRIDVVGVDGRKEDEEEIEIEVEGSLAPNGHQALAGELISYLVGCALGRWDIRIAVDQALAPKLQDPFAPLPVCSPGMLVGTDGLPANPGGIVSEAWLRARPDAITLPPEGALEAGKETIRDDEYPLAVAWNGILVDDEEHASDIVRRVRTALEVIWTERAEAIEREACELLGVGSLREYFRNPRHFFEAHIRRYSKSRRKAPIYWLLQSRRRSYGVWLYIHRTTADTYYRVLEDYVQPKLALETSRLAEQQRDLAGKKETLARSERVRREKDLATQESLVHELIDFRDELERVARLHLAPDLDDGVVLSIAPLHALVPWKEAKEKWEELRAGKYDWSTMAQRMRAKGLVR